MKNVTSIVRVLSKQRNVVFVFCPWPVTIDKRADWGPNADNLQHAPNGAFLKINDDAVTVSHLVQPNADKSAPVGWQQTTPGTPGLYDKLPIWVDNTELVIGSRVSMQTADGKIQYEIKEPSRVCYNGNENGADYNDGWVQTVKNLEKNYEFQAAAVAATTEVTTAVK